MHLNNIFYYSYFYRYKAARLQVKQLLQNNDIVNAETLLDQYIVENDNYIQNVTVEFATDDNSELHHSKQHLQAFLDTGQEYQKTKAENAL